MQQVYDLTVPELHNFVADDVCVHNTAFALGLATHAAVEAGKPVLVFSLEMSQLEVSQRILCAEARVDSSAGCAPASSPRPTGGRSATPSAASPTPRSTSTTTPTSR